MSQTPAGPAHLAQSSRLPQTSQSQAPSQCRLRRIQREHGDHDSTRSSPTSNVSSGDVHQNAATSTVNSASHSSLANSESDFDSSPTDSITYPFPPPGLSKSSSAALIVPEPDHPPNVLQHSSSEPDPSLWSAFRLESFLGTYCHTTTSLTTNTDLDPPSPNVTTPQPANPNFHTSKTLNSAPKSTLTTSICHVSTHPANPLILQRERQQAFMTHWNCVRQRNHYAPAMPSFFNPARQSAPACSWNFIRDPTCGGDVNEKLSARKGRESIFERALVQLPLTRCRSSCDRIRRGQQSLLGWGIYAWIGPSKHCRYCINDELIKGFLMFRSHEIGRHQEKPRCTREQQDRSIADAKTHESAIDSDAVLLSYPYRTSSSTPQDPEDQIQDTPTESFTNYNEIEPRVHISRTLPKGQDDCSNLDPQDISAWSTEVKNHLLASPAICDLDDLDFEDEDMGGFDDDEDLDSYYDSDEEEEEEEEEEEDDDEEEGDSGIVISEADVDDHENQAPQVNILQQVTKDANADFKKNKSNSDKTTTTICGKVLMSFWEEDDIDCVRVDVERVDGCVEVDDFSVGMGVVGSGMDEKKWRMDDRKVLEVQVQA